jgi:hypothetical protein
MSTGSPDVMDGCGHRCCEIPHNGYHTHTGRPSGCTRCATAPGTVGTGTLPDAATRPATDADRPHGYESHVLGRIVADVLARIAPQIPGLPGGTELTELVSSHALAVYASSLIDPDVQTLDEREQRTVLATRVGLALAFPVAH